MNAHAPPPVKTKRAGDLASASPNCLDAVDDTPLICAAQTWCEHSDTRIQLLANGPHHAKEICTDCGQVLRWVPKPQTVERQSTNAFRIAKRSMSGSLTSWEREFLKSLSQQRKLSPRQQACLDKIYTERLEGSTR
jgi:hypothetical protein